MNIQNIKMLADKLKAIGFDNTSYALIKRICLLPDSFTISEEYDAGADKVICCFYFEAEKGQSAFRLIYYDAVLQKQQEFPDNEIETINISGLNEKMSLTDWKNAFDFTVRKSFNLDDKNSFDNEARIEQVMTALNTLESSDAGKGYSITLKQHHWSKLPYQPEMGIITNGRNKSEISQRFYCGENQPIISVSEAYRFLQNRWMEKQMQSKRKQEDAHAENDTEETFATSGSGLLKKRRLNNNKTIKKNKASA